MLFMCPLLLAVFASAQHAANDHGALVMGFDQEKTVHHFYLYDDGGAIDVSVKDATDTKNLAAIRSHLPHIAMMFEGGDFDAPMLVHDTQNVPGTSALAKMKDRVSYTYITTPNGGRVNIATTDEAARTAIHDFLRYQIREHHTGDPMTVSPRR